MRLAGVLAGMVIASLGGAESASATYPVPYSAAAMAQGGSDPEASPAGSNDFRCRPGPAHPHPVVLVHGLLANQSDNWPTFAPLLANNGFCVFSLTYGRQPGNPYNGGLQQMEQSSQQLGPLVDRVLAATGAHQIDLLGHSEGTVMPRYWMSFRGGAAKVHRYVMLTPLWRGTAAFGTAAVTALGATFAPQANSALIGAFSTQCGSCPEFLTGSPFMNHLNAAGMALAGVGLHRHRDPLRRARAALHERDPRRPQRDQLHPPGPVSAGPLRARDGRGGPGGRPGRAQRARPGPRPAGSVHGGAPRRRCPGPALRGLSSGPATSPGPALGGTQGNARTRCGPLSSLAFVLHHRRGERIALVRAYVGRRLVLTRRGADITTLALAGLPSRSFVLRVKTLTDRGTRTTSRRRVSGFGKGRPRTVRGRRRPRR